MRKAQGETFYSAKSWWHALSLQQFEKYAFLKQLRELVTVLIVYKLKKKNPANVIDDLFGVSQQTSLMTCV